MYFPEETTTFYIIYYAIVGIIALGLFVFKAIGLYTICKNRAFEKCWLSFIPMINSYLIGKIADSYNATIYKKSNYKIKLLVLNIITIAGYAVVLPCYVLILSNMAGTEQVSPGNGLLIALFSIFIFIMVICIYANIIMGYVAQYKIYLDYVPHNATLYLVLSIFFYYIAPFFMFSIRNKQSISISRSMTPQIQYNNF